MEIVGIKTTTKTTCTGVEMFRKLLDDGQAGDNVGVLLARHEARRRGARPGAGEARLDQRRTRSSKAEVYVLTKEEGGRHTPFFNGYRPQFYFRTTDVTGDVQLPEGVEMVMPGDNIKMTVELITPIAMDEGLRFAIREGGRTVGAGVVAEILPDWTAEADTRTTARFPTAEDSVRGLALGCPWPRDRLRPAPSRLPGTVVGLHHGWVRFERQTRPAEECSSTGRAPVSKTGGWGFESLHSCQPARIPQSAAW